MYTVYTDGSCRGNGQENAVGAWGFVVVDENNQIEAQAVEVAFNTTNQRMELMAALRACQWCESHSNQGPFTIVSDSAYLINAYKQNWAIHWEFNGWITSTKQAVKNQDLWVKLLYYFKHFDYNFVKTKGHADDYYNNLVDELVQTASGSVKRG